MVTPLRGLCRGEAGPPRARWSGLGFEEICRSKPETDPSFREVEAGKQVVIHDSRRWDFEGERQG